MAYARLSAWADAAELAGEGELSLPQALRTGPPAQAPAGAWWWEDVPAEEAQLAFSLRSLAAEEQPPAQALLAKRLAALRARRPPPRSLAYGPQLVGWARVARLSWTGDEEAEETHNSVHHVDSRLEGSELEEPRHLISLRPAARSSVSLPWTSLAAAEAAERTLGGGAALDELLYATQQLDARLREEPDRAAALLRSLGAGDELRPAQLHAFTTSLLAPARLSFAATASLWELLDTERTGALCLAALCNAAAAAAAAALALQRGMAALPRCAAALEAPGAAVRAAQAFEQAGGVERRLGPAAARALVAQLAPAAPATERRALHLALLALAARSRDERLSLVDLLRLCLSGSEPWTTAAARARASRAAAVIQRAWRRRSARAAVAIRAAAAQVIVAAARAFLARRRRAEARNMRAQQRLVAAQLRAAADRLCAAATRLQAAFRGWRVRSVLRNERRFVEPPPPPSPSPPLMAEPSLPCTQSRATSPTPLPLPPPLPPPQKQPLDARLVAALREAAECSAFAEASARAAALHAAARDEASRRAILVQLRSALRLRARVEDDAGAEKDLVATLLSELRAEAAGEVAGNAREMADAEAQTAEAQTAAMQTAAPEAPLPVLRPVAAPLVFLPPPPPAPPPPPPPPPLTPFPPAEWASSLPLFVARLLAGQPASSPLLPPQSLPLPPPPPRSALLSASESSRLSRGVAAAAAATWEQYGRVWRGACTG